jgi:hypothetical protein
MWMANFDVFLQMDHAPEIRQGLGDATQEARAGLVALFLNVDEKSVIKESAQTLGAFYHALMIGVIAQRLMDPGQAPSARDLAEALQKLTVQMRPREKRRPTKQRPAVKDR